MRDLADALQVAGLRRDDSSVHHHRLENHPGDLPAVRSEHPLERRQVVVRHDPHQVSHLLGNARSGATHRIIDGPQLVGRPEDRHHRRIVVPVVGPFDLHDQRTTGDCPHQVDRVHGGFGTGVGEPPQRQAETGCERLCDHDGVVGRLSEVGAEGYPALHRLDQCRVGVTDHVDAIATVQIDVLRSVDVPHAPSKPVTDPHGDGSGTGPAGRDATGHHPLCGFPTLTRSGHPFDEQSFFTADQVVE